MNKTKFVSVLVVILAVTLSGSLALSAAELNVPSDYGSIQGAVDAASSGDTILIAEGDYSTEVRITKSNITLRSVGGADVTILRGTINIESAYGIVIDGLTVTGAGHGIRVRGNARGSEPALIVRNSSISGNTGNGIDFSHGASYLGVSIEDNEIDNNASDGINLQGVGDDVVISGNEISENGAVGATGVGVRVGSRAEGVVIENNTLDDNAFANIHPG